MKVAIFNWLHEFQDDLKHDYIFNCSFYLRI